MFATYAIALIGLGIWLVYSDISGLLKNIAAAKRSGLPWFIVRESKSFGPLQGKGSPKCSCRCLQHSMDFDS
jgi:hypothetical protein